MNGLSLRATRSKPVAGNATAASREVASSRNITPRNDSANSAGFLRRAMLVRVVARRDPRVDDAHSARAHAGEAALDRGRHVGHLHHRADALRALRARHRGNVDFGVGDALPDPAVFGGPAAVLGDITLVALVIEKRTIF